MLRSDAQANLDRILAAARKVFAERGLDAKLADVAAEAGVGVGTVYRRFASKEELVATLFDARLEDVVAEARTALEFARPLDGIVHFLAVTTQMMADDRALRDLLAAGRTSSAHGHLHLPDEMIRRVEALDEEVHELTGRLVEHAKADGSVRRDFSSTDLGVLSFTIQAAVDFGTDVSPEVWRRVFGMLIDGIRADGQRTPLESPALTQPQLARALRRKESW
ncbi:TetR/AcrR family transcriptional regulator [Rhodococcus sp. HNM0569]|uniref:TetR/AcrR family transcriptional regulator n=1 Tax=Rhodococcus sp. HNM0569 TaxID=2716340 RepID=UPI00146AD5AA|nr:TetR/AcrR family transcriptional regulator [Rhodococcus sp. HNM0569]NLU84826.1 TetR/AcrR family transcriptional regulator [Rhodococcus sp. HNM0569]